MLIERRSLIVGAGLLAASPAWGQGFSSVPAPYVRGAEKDAIEAGPLVEGMVRVTLATAEGIITLDLNQARAPITSANFLHYIDTKRFDGAEFYRATHPPGDADYGVVQGGIPNNPERLFKPIAHEPTSKTGLQHRHGAISMARFAPGSALADFFICIGDQPYLDADLSKPGDNLGFAAFGQVAAGMSVVKKILGMPTDGVAKSPDMKGQILTHPVKISQARRA